MSATHSLDDQAHHAHHAPDARLPEPGVSPEPEAHGPGAPDLRAASPLESLDVPDDDPELARLEALLHVRTRQQQALAAELARCDRLLREALERIPTLASSELQALRRGYDAAVERAIEAEVARAELTFALDEARAQLTAAPTSSAAVGAVGHRAAAPGVYARVAELEEAEGTLHARLMLAEQDRDSAQARIRELTRELQESGERVELHLARERAQEQALAARGGREHVLAAYAAGLSARADESEGAFRAAYARAQQLEQRLADKQARLAEARAETAEQLVLVQSQAARIEELQRSLAIEQQEQRSLRAQIEASVAAQRQQTAAREADEAQWAERVRELSEREQRADAELRKLLGSLKQPLRELDASLNELGPDARMLPVDEVLRSDSTEPGTIFEGVSDAPLVEQLRQRERQVAELEAALARYGQSPSTVGLAAPGAKTETMRLTDELARERTRRKRLGATVRALQAASEAGEPTAPWIQELATILTEGASLPPK